MSKQAFLDFLLAVRDDPARRARYTGRNLTQVRFHASHEGFDFSTEDIAAVVGPLEYSTVVLDGEEMDGSSTLWRHMWGRSYLDYLIEFVVRRHTDEQLRAVVAGPVGAEAAA
jgi:hypothetical protein